MNVPIENVELVEALETDRQLIERLVQLYAYDFSEILGSDVDADGRFTVISLGLWPSDRHRCFVIRVGGHAAGFAAVDKGSALRDAPDVMDMGEFFVMRRYRLRGVGRIAAHTLFDMFPGRWEVRELTPNVGAQSFWRSVIGVYTGGAYNDDTIDDERWQGPVQSFVSKGGTQR